MSSLYQILIPTLVGAAVGGFTNLLAIKMLFHPLAPIYIGKWRLPFTPGLIPKRREEIAEKLGDLVIRHLISTDRLQKKITDDDFSRQATCRIKKWLQNFMSGKKVGDVIDAIGDRRAVAKILIDEMDSSIGRQISRLLIDIKEKPLNEALPPTLTDLMDSRLSLAADLLLNEVLRFLKSPEGKIRVMQGIEDFVDHRGRWGEFIFRLIGRDNLYKKVYPEFIRMIGHPVVRKTAEDCLKAKWLEVQGMPVNALIARTGIDWDTWVSHVAGAFRQAIDPERFFDLPINQLAPEYQRSFFEKVLPGAVSSALGMIGTRTKQILDAIDLKEMVTDQVRSFSLSELEQIVFSISKKELRLIAYLGYLLGGLIGLSQGVLTWLL